MAIGKTDTNDADRDRGLIMLQVRAALETMYAQVSSCGKLPPLIYTGEFIIPSQCLRRLQHTTPTTPASL